MSRKMMLITLANEEDRYDFRVPKNSYGVDIRIKESDLQLDPNDFIQRYLYPSVVQLLNEFRQRRKS